MRLLSKRSILLVIGLVVVLAAGSLLIGNAQANTYQSKLSDWQTANASLIKSLQTNTFSDKMATDHVETTSELTALQQSCTTEKNNQAMVTSLRIPSLGFNPLGFLSSSYRNQHTKQDDANETLTLAKQALKTPLQDYHTFCQFYTYNVANSQQGDKAKAAATALLTQDGTQLGATTTCVSLGGCLPENNKAVWPQIADNYETYLILEFKDYLTYLQKNGCYLSNFTPLCTVQVQYNKDFITAFQGYIDAVRSQDDTKVTAAITAQNVVTGKYSALYAAAIKKIDPSADTSSQHYSTVFYQTTMKNIESNINTQASNLAKI